MKNEKKNRKIKRLPVSFQPLFWSYRFNELDEDNDRSLIIKHILLYGSLEQWRWMIRHYGRQKIRKIISCVSASELRPSAVELAKAAFNIKVIPHARRVPHKSR